MHITFIQTGGTIDKDYPRIKGSYAFEIDEPAVKRILEKITPNFTFSIKRLLKKDSLELTDADREKIKKACQDSKGDNIIITHGTDTMIQTSEVVSSIKKKVIILTGAMMPERFVNSDAMFNIGSAVGAISFLKPGVYIAMSGRIYEWDKCEKSDDCVFIGKKG